MNTYKQHLESSDYKDLANALERGDEYPQWLIEWAIEYYADSMPYGTLTGDTETVDEYLCDRIDEVVEHFEDELKAVNWSGEII